MKKANKEELLKQRGKFTWDFGDVYFIETNIGNFLWSDPYLAGDNTMTQVDKTMKEYFQYYRGINQGIRDVSYFCGNQWEMRYNF